jgi:hypothetical protein
MTFVLKTNFLTLTTTLYSDIVHILHYDQRRVGIISEQLTINFPFKTNEHFYVCR